MMQRGCRHLRCSWYNIVMVKKQTLPDIDLAKPLFKWGPIDASMLLITFPTIALCTGAKGRDAYRWPDAYGYLDKEKFVWLNDLATLMRISENFTRSTILKRGREKTFLRFWRSTTKSLLEVFREIDRADLSALSDVQLITLYIKLKEAYSAYWIPAGTLEFINLALEQWLRGALEVIITDTEERNRALNVLSAPVDLTFYRQEEKKLIEIGRLPRPEQKTALQRHTRKYFWMYNSYLEAKALDANYFAQELRRVERDGTQTVYWGITTAKQRIRKEKNVLVQKYRLNSSVRQTVRLLERYTIWQDIRKKENFLGNHYVYLLLRAIAKRKKVSVRLARQLMPNELTEFVRMKSVARWESVMQKRLSQPTVLAFVGKRQRILSRSETQIFLRQYHASQIQHQSAVLQGIVASGGKSKYFRGIARIVRSSKEIQRVGNGEILVTGMTAPDYVVGMKRAGAVITDQGGLTCHAAIVSRELGIPCIVGTKFATKVIKDGDTVEIHAGRGIVKIVAAKAQ